MKLKKGYRECKEDARMFAATHKLIARKVYEMTASEYGFLMDYKSLLYGSVAPDLHPSMLVMDHDMEGSFELVKNHIEWLKSCSLPVTKREKKVFSFRLGIVIHFVTDYFCQAHNEKRYKNMLLHFVYEHKLKNFIQNQLGKIKEVPSITPPVEGSVECYIEQKQREFNMQERSMLNDMVYSVGVSARVSMKIAEACMANNRIEMFIKEFEQNLRTA